MDTPDDACSILIKNTNSVVLAKYFLMEALGRWNAQTAGELHSCSLGVNSNWGEPRRRRSDPLKKDGAINKSTIQN